MPAIVQCCPEHGHVSPTQACANHGHTYNTLYPDSVYYCPQCSTQHGTSAVNGAVSWQCMDCWAKGRGSVPQHYLGRTCWRCGFLDKTGATLELVEYSS